MKIKEALLRARHLLCLEAVIREGSISKAAEKNNMKQSNFSVLLKELEDTMGERLINRLHSGVSLTEAGSQVYPLACDIYNLLNKNDKLKNKTFHVKGSIKLWTSDGLAAGYISNCLPKFYLAFPKVNIEIICSLEMPQPEQFDMAVIYKEPTDSHFKVLSKYDLKFGLFASKEYLAHLGYPKNIKDIQENHRICTRDNYTEVWPQWQEVVKSSEYVCASANSSSMLLHLIKDGIGIGPLPLGTACKEDNLIHLSHIKLNLHHKFWVVVRQNVQNVDKIKSLIKFIDDASQKL